MTYPLALTSGLLLSTFYAAISPLALSASAAAHPYRPNTAGNAMDPHPYVGMWVTDDGHVRQELLPNNRYDEARGTQQSAYQGRYEINGRHIEYWDDTGFTADGDFVDPNTLHHGGMIFRRR